MESENTAIDVADIYWAWPCPEYVQSTDREGPWVWALHLTGGRGVRSWLSKALRGAGGREVPAMGHGAQPQERLLSL